MPILVEQFDKICSLFHKTPVAVTFLCNYFQLCLVVWVSGEYLTGRGCWDMLLCVSRKMWRRSTLSFTMSRSEQSLSNYISLSNRCWVSQQENGRKMLLQGGSKSAFIEQSLLEQYFLVTCNGDAELSRVHFLLLIKAGIADLKWFGVDSGGRV